MTRDREYVGVRAVIDSTGYMTPSAIRWHDGRVFPIDSVVTYRPASALIPGHPGSVYVVRLCGTERCLFYERDPHDPRRIRWYVEPLPAVHP